MSQSVGRPQISCGFTTLDSFDQFLGNSVFGVGIEARGNFTDQDDLDSFFSKVNETDATIVEAGQKCLKSDGAFLKYMGTVSPSPYIPFASSLIFPLLISGSCCTRHSFSFRFLGRPRKTNQLLGIQVGLSSQNLGSEINVCIFDISYGTVIGMYFVNSRFTLVSLVFRD